MGGTAVAGSLRHFLQQFHTDCAANADRYLGCHPCREGYVFRVWAPKARAVSVVGDFNFWNEEDLPMKKLDSSVWEAVSVHAQPGQAYKFCVTGADGKTVLKTDPYAFRREALPGTSGLIGEEKRYRWSDSAWRRQKSDTLCRPVNIYEVHAGSWRKHADGSSYTYEELAKELVPYVKDMGYTHIEFLPLSEYPYEPSWGYQVTGYFSPTCRYGTPNQLRKLVNACHRAGLGVILDWVPAHFPKDAYALFEFDGSSCYEVADPRMREHPDWGTRIFDYAKPEVRSFLISSACRWLREFHIDGIRVDAVASMLYLDYNRKEFVPNCFGGRENLAAAAFLRQLNRAAFAIDPHVMMIAEESSTWPGVTKPDYDGGLGFLYKWNMGWMNDTLMYMSLDPLYRKGSHDKLTFSMTYAYSENFVLPLSHDEVVYLKKSLIGKMPGSYEDRFSNLHVYLAFQMAHPGKKLTFMGTELAQFDEWDYRTALQWSLLDYEQHRLHRNFVRELNRFYRSHSALWENDRDWEGFQWISCDDRDNSVLAFRRMDRAGKELLAVFNFCPVLREDYPLGLPAPGRYVPVFQTDEKQYGGFGYSAKPVEAVRKPRDGYPCQGRFRIPPMSAVFYEAEETEQD